jgi:NHS family xanthosine MFS transporter
LYVSAAAGVTLGVYAFSMPACFPIRTWPKPSLFASLGLDAFVLFKKAKMLIFFIFSMLLGFALQISNAFADGFISDFAHTQRYAGAFAVRHSVLLISISQISETLFILTIPFFLRRFGIKMVILMSIFAWVFRFGLFGIGNPGSGLSFLILSMIVYGMAFDFFNISGSLFVEREADVKIRASAQGLFMVMTNGFGAWAGTFLSGLVVDHFTENGVRDWHSIWMTFAGYALVLGIVFPLVFIVEVGSQINLRTTHVQITIGRNSIAVGPNEPTVLHDGGHLEILVQFDNAVLLEITEIKIAGLVEDHPVGSNVGA